MILQIKALKKVDKILDIVAWGILFVSWLLLGFSGRILENIIHGKQFVLKFGLLGVFIAITVLFVIHKTNKQYLQSNSMKRGSAVLSYFFGIVIITFFSFGFYNYSMAEKNQVKLEAVVIDKFENVRYKTGYIELSFNGKKERFDVKRSVWEKINKNDTINIVVGKENLGYNYIFSFESR